MTKKRSDIKAQALKQMRRTREKINEAHPELLSGLKARLDNAQSREPEIQDIKIDRKKNLESVMKFLEAKSSYSPAFQDKLKDVLRDTEL